MGFHLIKKIIHHLQLGFAVIGGIHALAKGVRITQAFAIPTNVLAGSSEPNVFSIKGIVVN